MLKKSPDETVRLTDEQTAQLGVFYSRLSALQTETAIGKKNLDVLKEENIKTTKEKMYLEESVESLTKKVSLLKKQASDLSNEVSGSHSELTKHRKELSVRGEMLAQQKREQDVAQGKLDESGKVLHDKLRELNSNTKKLSEEKLSVEKAKEAFSKAAESIVWK